MKKLVENLFGFAACGLVALAMTSCHTNNEVTPSAQTTEVNIVASTPKTLVVNLSAALPSGASLKYNGQTASSTSGLSYTFKNVANGKNVVLTGGNVIEQKVAINFGEKTVYVLDLTVRTQNAGTEIAAGTETTTTDNYGGSTSTVTLPAGAATGALVGKKLSITMFSTFSPIENPQVGTTQSVPAYGLDCQPDGATFPADQPVVVETTLPGTNGCDVALESADGSEKPSQEFKNEKLTAKMTHFSVWNIILNATFASMEESTEDIASGSLKAGSNVVNYNEVSGFETSETSDFLLKVFSALFKGKKTTVASKVVLTSESDASYRIYQDVKNYVLKSGSKTMNVKVYGSVHCQVTASTPVVPVEPTHSGGSND